MKRIGLALGAILALTLPLTPLGLLILASGLALCVAGALALSGAAYVAVHLAVA
jgi:hypothetical protein